MSSSNDDTEREGLTEGTEIVYVPGAVNRYDYSYDVIVLDRALKEYPKAHDAILEHELKHVQNSKGSDRWLVDLIRIEWREDLRHYLGNSEEASEIRDYYKMREAKYSSGWATSIETKVVHNIRPFWCIFLGIVGSIKNNAGTNRGKM